MLTLCLLISMKAYARYYLIQFKTNQKYMGDLKETSLAYQKVTS